MARFARPFACLCSLLLILAGASVVRAGTWEGPLVNICDDGAEWPPYSFYQRVDGAPTRTVVGFSVDVIDHIFAKRNIPWKLSLVPWKRCMHEVAKGERYHMLLSAGRNPQRNRTYLVSEPYYQMHTSYLYSKKHHPRGLSIAGREELKKYRVCGIQGYNYIVFGLPEDEIDTGSADYDSLVKKLLNGRCELSVDRLEILMGFKAIGKEFIVHPDLGFRIVPGEPAEPFHMMFTKSDLGHRLKRIVDDGIKELQASGELDAMMRKYDLFIAPPQSQQ